MCVHYNEIPETMQECVDEMIIGYVEIYVYDLFDNICDHYRECITQRLLGDIDDIIIILINDVCSQMELNMRLHVGIDATLWDYQDAVYEYLQEHDFSWVDNSLLQSIMVNC